MTNAGSVVVVGGTRAIGLEIAKAYAADGAEVVLTGRSREHVTAAVEEAGRLGAGSVRGLIFDLAEPETIGPGLADIGPVRRLALVAIDRDENTIRDYDIARAMRLVTLKLVGYTEVVHALLDRLTPDVVDRALRWHGQGTPVPRLDDRLDGQRRRRRADPHARRRARPRSRQLDPSGHRRQQPLLGGKPAAIERPTSETPMGRLVTMAEIVDATRFLLENTAVNGVDLIVDGGLHAT